MLFHRTVQFVAPVSLFLLLAGCDRAPTNSTEPLRQRGYVWQRDWTSGVAESVAEAERRLDGVVLLGAEVDTKVPSAIRANIDWEKLKGAKKPLALALRVTPFSGPFVADDGTIKEIARVAKSLLEDAKGHGVSLAEFQLDFDCAQKNLAGYRRWLGALRPAIQPARFVITALPSWLDEPDFLKLIDDVDGYVLQVHSVPTLEDSGRAVLCDPRLARKWMVKAAKLGRPFAVSLPTYRCLAGYDPNGKLLGVAFDSVQPSWPRGTRVVEYSVDADEIADIVAEWRAKRPKELRELFWYRVPVTGDIRNWRWPTLLAVMSGRKPAHRLEVLSEGENPVDVSITNAGEADEQRNPVVTVRWNADSTLVASDALPGWTLKIDNQRAVFSPASEYHLRLSPGSRRSIGWLRYDRTPKIRAQVEEPGERPL
jgi:uncharacterized protein DUF3142